MGIIQINTYIHISSTHGVRSHKIGMGFICKSRRLNMFLNSCLPTTFSFSSPSSLRTLYFTTLYGYPRVTPRGLRVCLQQKSKQVTPRNCHQQSNQLQNLKKHPLKGCQNHLHFFCFRIVLCICLNPEQILNT